MRSVSQIVHELEQILEVEVEELARESGFIKRERLLTGADFAQCLIFGSLQERHLSLCAMSQVAERRCLSISAPGLCQRFTREAASFMQAVLHRLSLVHFHSQVPDLPLLSRFSAVIVEDSTTIRLPAALRQIWPDGHAGKAALKLFVQLDLLSGRLSGPLLCRGGHADCKSPFDLDSLPAESLYLADLGFFSLARLQQIDCGQAGSKRFFVTRLRLGTTLWTKSGHRLVLAGVLPKQVGEVRELGVVLGRGRGLSVRLIVQRVSQEVAEQRRQRMREEAADEGREANEEALSLASWTIVLTNVSRSRLSCSEVLVLLAARWQIERVFLLWKQQAALSTCQSLNPWRILCECYAKLAGLVIEHWLIAAGCWDDDERSLVKAAQVVRRECNRLMVALWEGQLETVLPAVLRCMGSGCRVEKRRRFPSTAQTLQSGQPRTEHRGGPRKARKPRIHYWPMGRGWACSGRPSRRKCPARFLT